MGFIERFPLYWQILILFNFLMIVTGIILVYSYNFIYIFYNKKNKKLPKIFTALLTKMIFDKEKIEKEDLVKIQQLGINKSRTRKLLLKVLFHFSLFLKGDERMKINTIYRALNLHKSGINNLSSKINHNVISAVNELSQFRILVRRDQITALQKSKNDSIREVANVYTLKLYRENLYDFFDYSDKPLSKWEQLKYFQQITNRSKLKKPHFKKWIDPKYHSTIIELALDLAAHYYQDNAAASIHQLISTKNKGLRLRMINTLGKLNHISSLPVLMDLYPNENYTECKREIIKSLGYMGFNCPEVEVFLLKVYRVEENLNLKKAIIVALKRNKSESLLSSVNYNIMEKELIRMN